MYTLTKHSESSPCEYVSFSSLFWRNVSPRDLFTENTRKSYGKLNELTLREYNEVGTKNEARY